MYSIYALVDPRTEEVRYIGYTGNLKNRYTTHCSLKDKGNPEKQAWVDELKALKLKPQLIVLEETPEKADALLCEKSWIQAYLEQGAILTNVRDADLAPPECRMSEEEWSIEMLFRDLYQTVRTFKSMGMTRDQWLQVWDETSM